MTTIKDRKMARVDTVPNNHVDGRNVDSHHSSEHVCPMMLYLYS